MLRKGSKEMNEVLKATTDTFLLIKFLFSHRKLKQNAIVTSQVDEFTL